MRRSVTSLLATALVLAPLAATPAFAQMDSREGIALQNQILQLRQELDAVRRNAPSGAGGGSSLGGSYVPPPSRGGAPAAGGGGELVGQLLDRVNNLEEETRRLRGRAEEAEYRNKQLSDQVEKLSGDMDYRLQQLEGGKAGSGAAPAPAPARPPASASGSLTPPGGAAAPAAAAAPRTPEKALADGQAALGRRDYPSAEAAARVVIAARNTARAQDAQLLLGQSLLGRRDYQNAAVAFDDAYRRNRQSARAPEAMLGLANSFLGFGAKKEACATLGDLRNEFPRLSGSLNQQAQETGRRGGC